MIHGQKIKYKIQKSRYVSTNIDFAIKEAIFLRDMGNGHILVENLDNKERKSIFRDYVL